MKKTLSVFLLIGAGVFLVSPLLAGYAQNVSVATRGRIVRDGDEKKHTPYMDDSGPRKTDRPLYEVEQLERRCFDEVNRQRKARGLAPLRFSDELLPLARYYSWRMAEEKFFSHTDPEGRTIKERVSEYGIRWRVLGENLAYSNGYVNPVAASLSGWMDSPGHRKNILESVYTQSAIGAWISANGTVYFTQIFISK
ncbi:MAG: CAP domain-containing protein [Acidobacteriota bacterium]